MAEERRPTAPTYLGDGAYAVMMELGLEIYTHNGVEKTNRVVLGDSELIALLRYLEANDMIEWRPKR